MIPSTDPGPLPAVPDGYRVRPLALPDDAEPLVGLVRAYDAAFGRRAAHPPERTVHDLTQMFGRDDGGAVLVEAADGTTAAFASYEKEPRSPKDDGAVFYVDALVLPVHATRLGGALVDWALARCRDRLARLDDEHAEVHCLRLREDVTLCAAHSDRGFEQERTFWRMQRMLGPDVEGDPPAPPGVVLRVADGEDDHRLLHRLWLDIFAAHWGHRPSSFDDWWTRIGDAWAADPRQWRIAEVDGVPAAFSIGDDSRARDGGGHVRVLGVLLPARGRGVAKHLLRTAFAADRAAGRRYTGLTVDAQNETGATDLYRSVGMEPVEVVDAFAARIVADPTTRDPA